METRKENKPATRITRYRDQVLLHKDTDIISPRVLLCIAKQRELCTGTEGSLEFIRVTVGINMDVQIPLLIIDRKEFRVMSTFSPNLRGHTLKYHRSVEY